MIFKTYEHLKISLVFKKYDTIKEKRYAWNKADFGHVLYRKIEGKNSSG